MVENGSGRVILTSRHRAVFPTERCFEKQHERVVIKGSDA